MYNFLRHIILRALACPTEPPDAPAGSEASTIVFRAAPAYFHYRLLKIITGLVLSACFEAGLIVFLLIGAGMAGIIIASIILIIAATKALLLVVTTRLEYEMLYYIITDRSLRIREGVWVIREITMTFENVQNLKISQGPMQRFFSIHDLLVESAGGGGAMESNEKEGNPAHTAAFRGLGKPEALRDQILAYLRRVQGAGLGDDRAAAKAKPGGFSPSEVQALRAIAQETAALRQALSPS